MNTENSNNSFTKIFFDNEPTNFIEFEYEGKLKKIYGGSFFQAPLSDKYLKINLMEEYPNLQSDIYFPIKDFSVPNNMNDLRLVFEELLNSEKDVYVGCFAGLGRTGLFMASLLKYVGHNNPIIEVREQYNSHAVETQSQQEYVNGFPSLEKKAKFKM